MKKILSYILSIIFYLCFGFILVFFHIIQVITIRLFGYKPHKDSVDWLNYYIMRCLNILGTRIIFENNYVLNTNKPHIIVANHQSMYDIPPLIWYLRRLHPKFISKKELGKGIPSISYNLRHGGSVLIDRKDGASAVKEIKSLAQYMHTYKRSAVIFPEGTRSRDGKLKRFSENGLKTLTEYCPNAIVLPISINNSWQLQQYGMFPLPLGVKIRFKAHKPIDSSQYSFEEIYEYCVNTIKSKLND